MSFIDASLVLSNGLTFTLQNLSTFKGFVYRTRADQDGGGMVSTANDVHILTAQNSVTDNISRGDTIDCENGSQYYVMREPFRSLSNSLMKIYVKVL